VSIESDADLPALRRVARVVEITVRDARFTVPRPLSGRGADGSAHEEPAMLMAAL
jgi:hypothetical protein